MKLHVNRHLQASVHAQLKEQVKYQIATGQIDPGTKLPSIRKLEGEIGVNRNTILRVFRELTDEGVLRCGPRSGFFSMAFADDSWHTRVRAEAARLARGMERGARKVGVPPLFLARYVHQEMKNAAAASPFIGYVECTEGQLSSHCRNLEAALDVPVTPYLLSRLRGSGFEIDDEISILVTSLFHFAEIRRAFAGRDGPRVRSVIIRPDRSIVKRLSRIPGSPRIAIIEPASIPNREFSRSLRAILPRGSKVRTVKLSKLTRSTSFRNVDMALFASRDRERVHELCGTNSVLQEAVFEIAPASIESLKKDTGILV